VVEERMNREVLRILLPEERGVLLTRSECSDDYKRQLDNIESSVAKCEKN